jgi:hypothetical protein
MKILRTIRLGCLASLWLFSTWSSAMEIPEIPKVPAFLPTVEQVPATQPMPLDGTWLVPVIGKKIRIDSGRAYAVDGWTHLFVLDIQPGMVVLKDLVPTGPGQYAGEDLPLMGRLTARVMADKSISVSVAGVLGQANYKLVPVQINNQGWFQQEMQAAGIGGNNHYQSQSYQTQNYQMSAPPGSLGQPVNQQQHYQNSQYRNPNQQYQTRPNQQQQHLQQQYSPQYQQVPRNQPPQYVQQPQNQPQFTPQRLPNQQLPNRQQDVSESKASQSESECQEKIYDPETDTIRCYEEGNNQ